MIADPFPHNLTQGTIFTCAASEDYPDVEVRGLVITARCDVAHGKAPIISYVPLIAYEDWLLRDGLRILAARALASANGSMKNAIKDAGLSESIFETLAHELISAHLNGLTEKPAKTIAKRFDEALSARRGAEAALKTPSIRSDAKTYIASQHKEYNKIAQDLLSNLISDFHYFESSEPGEICHGYVALMREIRFIPAVLAEYIKHGIDSSYFSELCSKSPQFRDKIVVRNPDSYAMPVGLVRSPFIEFFMQRFTNLFSRIGVTDYSPERLSSIRSIVPFQQDI